MNVPRKHHYVPIVHIEKFKGESNFYVYSKSRGDVLKKKSSNSFFFIKDLNSTINDVTGSVDHSIIENNLGKKWDNRFNYHFDNIISWIKDSIKNDSPSNLDLNETLKFFFEYAVVNKFRSFKQLEEFNSNSLDWVNYFDDLDEVFDNTNFDLFGFTEERKIEIINFSIKIKNDFNAYVVNAKSKLRFPAPTPQSAGYIVPEKCSVDIFLSTDVGFILPDTTSLLIKSDVVKLYNYIKVNQISSVGIPISKNIFLQIRNIDVLGVSESNLYAMKANRVMDLNKALFKGSIDQVVSSDSILINSVIKSC